MNSKSNVFSLWHNGDPNSGGRGDLCVASPCLDFKECFDSYYILGDLTIPIPTNKPKGLIENIKLRIPFVINQLINLVKNLKLGDTKYFPIGLSDQYSDCLRLKSKDTHSIEIAFGSTRIEGYNVGFANISLYNPGENEFNLKNGPCIVGKKELIESLEASIENIETMKIVESTPKRKTYSGVTFIYNHKDNPEEK